MPEPRTEHVKQIRDRISRHEYEVDPAAVAEAILARLLERLAYMREA